MKNSIGIGTLALIFMLVIAAYFVGVNYAKEDVYMGRYTAYTIMPNDTIWSIANDFDGNTANIVYTIRKDNGINDCGNLQIGQQIMLREEY